ncbi:acyltransferase [Ampullimonas aquatilis]|uniref:acyltransferase n=1 Tax=Ampullimonas aquatilis TaxID=1341549 RepID=UPI003C7303D2
MTFKFLWENREKPNLFSERWLKVWAKRILNMTGLMTILVVRRKWMLQGMKIGTLSILYKFDLNGRAANLIIGDSTFIAAKSHFAIHEKVVIGSCVVINEGVKILTASHDLNDPQWKMYSKPIIIDDYAWIATNAIILPGVSIGKGAVVAAGAVVGRDVPPFALAIGNPAEIRLDRRIHNLDYNPVVFAAPYEAWIGRNAQLFSVNNDTSGRATPRINDD